MKVNYDRPPLWGAINQKFQVEGKAIIFAWGDTIFNPEQVPLTKELHAHEEVHGARQLSYSLIGVEKGAIQAWWERYLVDPEFRLAEEIPAHAAEYKAYCKRHYGGSARRIALAMIAGKLASPLYGGLITLAAAKEAIILGQRTT